MIELKHLKTLYILHKEGSVIKAANHLCLSQSALSHQLKELEHRLNFQLFVRKTSPILFTPQGEILLNLAIQVLPLVKNALHACHQSETKLLRIAIECHSCILWLMPALDAFEKAFPNVEIDFMSGVSFDPQPALQQGSLDLVMTSDQLQREDVYYIPMFDFEVRLVVAPQHPLAKKSMINAEDLKAETLLIYPVQRQRLDIWRDFLKPNGIEPTLKNVDNTLLLIQMVSAQMGIAALPHWVVHEQESQGLVVTRPLNITTTLETTHQPHNKGLWRRLYSAVRMGEQNRPEIIALVDSTCHHALESLPFVIPYP